MITIVSIIRCFLRGLIFQQYIFNGLILLSLSTQVPKYVILELGVFEYVTVKDLMWVDIVKHLIVILGEVVVIAAQVALLVWRQQSEVREFPIHQVNALTQVAIVSLEKLL